MPNAVIHLNNIKHNAQRFKSLAPHSQLLAIVKANAYGHNALQVSQVLHTTADGFGVAHIGEAIEIRQLIEDKPVVILSEHHTKTQFIEYAKHNLSPVIHSLEHINQLNGVALTKPLNIWLKIDTGMHRLGINPTELAPAIKQLSANNNVRHITLMSHFACADEAHNDFEEQLTHFNQYNTHKLPVSLANTAALLRSTKTHKQWIRPGIGLYGANPLLNTALPNHDFALAPSMSLYAPVIACKTVKQGETVGYGNTWQAKRDSKIAVIGIGYADGYPRHAANGTPVFINNATVKLAGRVSMDMITVDITDHLQIKAGDVAELWGHNVSISDVATSAGTIPYELMCKITSRVTRSYQ